MKRKSVIALLCAIAAATACTAPAFAANESIVNTFKNPDVSAKPMARYWFPDASPSYEDLEREMTELYNAGYGGVEVAYFPGEVSFDNTLYGWGTEAWRDVMKNMLKIAASFEDGFIVDFTITSGWPVAFNDIDPNDAVADREVVAAAAKVTDASGMMELPMNQIAVQDTAGNPFIFTNTLVGAVIAKVVSVDAAGKPVIDPASVKVLETSTTGRTTVAGIPAVDGLAEDSDEYQYIAGLYEGEIPDTSIFFTDSVGNPYEGRTALKDVQEYWQTDLAAADLGDYTASEGEELAEGDYVIFCFYEKGTGHTIMDMGKWAQYENPQPSPSYETSPYTAAAVEEIAKNLDEYVFGDEELVDLMKAAAATVGGAIFEDSLENEYKGLAWGEEIQTAFQGSVDYDVISKLPFLFGSAVSTADDIAQIKDDYNAVLNDMYLHNHIEGVQKYVNEKTDYSYRAQAYHTRATITGSVLDTSAASAILDLSEGESLAFGGNYDNYRYVSAGVHAAGKNQISSESFAIQDGSAYNLTWDRVTKIANGMYAAGVNKVIYHGTSIDKSNGNVYDYAFSQAWPGWSAFINICTDDWDGRMPYFEDVNILTDYQARNQAVLLNGTSKVDLLVYDLYGYDHKTRKENGDNSRFNVLLDAGYTYEDVMTSGLLMDEVCVTDGVLCADGPAYKAVIVNSLASADKAAMEKLLSIAEAGVPVIFYSELPNEGAGISDTDQEIRDLAQAILDTGNGVYAKSQIEIQNELVKRGIRSNASYLKSNVRVQVKEDEDGSMYYYVYNNNGEAVDVEMNLTGSGELYLLNAWNGEIVKGSAIENGDGVLTTLHFEPYGTIIAAVSAYAESFDAAEPVSLGTAGKAISLDTWNLTIESFGPDFDTEEITDAKKVNLEIGETGLAAWADMNASEEQLAETGAASMADVSGIGYYTTQVDLSEVAGVKGGVLTLTHGSDMITGIKVNGVEVTDLNPTTNTYKIGEALVSGVNTIEIKLATTIRNRARVESGYFGGMAQVSYGITNASLVPYTE